MGLGCGVVPFYAIPAALSTRHGTSSTASMPAFTSTAAATAANAPHLAISARAANAECSRRPKSMRNCLTLSSC